jgi:hypothetical protein
LGHEILIAFLSALIHAEKLLACSANMKKAISIFFLLLFFLFQYGKMLDYMECRIAAAIEAKEDCGCDTKLTDSPTGNSAPQPFHQHQLKNYTEEFFDHCFVIPSINAAGNRPCTNVWHPASELSGYSIGVLQPPQI